MSFQLQKALHILQLSQMELKQFIQEELEKNPLLEEISSPQSNHSFAEIPHKESLYAKILRQIKESFEEESDQKIAQILLEHLDEKGFISLPLEEIKNFHHLSMDQITSVLNVLQTIHPPGVFARNLQESLLLQLKAQGNTNTEAFHIVENYFSDLIHGRYKKIQNKSKINNFRETIDILAKLRLRPIEDFSDEIVPHVTPDFTIHQIENNWSCSLNEEDLPKLEIRTDYESLKLISSDEKETLSCWTQSAKWLLRSLKTRRQILTKIVFYVLKYQINYLLGDGHLKKLSLQEVAKHLNLHESTVSRAISHKYVKTARGTLLIRSLFTASVTARSAKQILEEIISQENKKSPLTDSNLSEELQKRGLSISRRTVAKYRKELKIIATSARKTLS